jgi:hypothetical protein
VKSRKSFRESANVEERKGFATDEIRSWQLYINEREKELPDVPIFNYIPES